MYYSKTANQTYGAWLANSNANANSKKLWHNNAAQDLTTNNQTRVSYINATNGM